jgi:hypothetical protein
MNRIKQSVFGEQESFRIIAESKHYQGNVTAAGVRTCDSTNAGVDFHTLRQWFELKVLSGHSRVWDSLMTETCEPSGGGHGDTRGPLKFDARQRDSDRKD